MMTYLYALTEPDGEVRYVGKTAVNVRRRLVSHISEARRGGRGHKCNWIRSLLLSDAEPIILHLHTVHGDGCRDESIVIAAFRAAGIRLTNATDGGEGRTGVKRTEAEKAFLSRLHKGREISWGAKISASKKGVKFSAEHCRKLSEAQRTSPKVKQARKRGEASHHAVLTESDVRNIRQDTRTHRLIAADFGVSQANVSLIKSRRKWAHVQDEGVGQA